MKNKTNITNKERWRVSLHEAGHTVIWLKLTSSLFRPSVKCVLFDGGGGCASCKGTLSDFSYMVMTASGKQAERFASSHPAPRRIKRPPTAAEIISNKRLHPIITAEITESFSDISKLISDPELIAKHCIQFQPDSPKDWKQRHRRIHANARFQTWINRKDILKTARKLFQDGAYFAAAEKDPHSQTETNLLSVKLTDKTTTTKTEKAVK